MEHPFITSLTDKTLEELEQARTSLTEKINFAYKTGNMPLVHQLTMAMESYKNEYTKRMDEIFKKQNISNQIKVQNDS
jgi:hypothetical protein